MLFYSVHANERFIYIRLELLPNQGWGKIPFGLNISQVSTLEDILGKLTLQGSPIKSPDETHELLKGLFPEEEVKELLKLMEEINIPQDVNIQNFINSEGVVATFEDDVLMDIYAADRAKNLHIQGIPIFSSDPLYLVLQMVSILSEKPIAKEEDVVFPKSNIYLFDFLNEDGTRAANKERTISWRNSPRILSVSLADYKELDILND